MDHVIKDIIFRLKQGDKSAFNQLFERYHRRIYLFCLHYHYGKEEAEEIVQEVFLKLWLNRNSIDSSGNVQSFIYTIARNLIFNNLKRKIYQKAAYQYHYTISNKVSQTEDDIICRDLERIFNKAINTLPKKRQQIFNLSRKDGLSNKEIAEKLNISLKTVESQIRLSLQYLRRVLKQHANTILIVLIIIKNFH